MIYRNVLAPGLPRRTWPYGERKRVKVAIVERTTDADAALAVEETSHEGFLLLGVSCEGVDVGQEREIVFVRGGPEGGFWDFVREVRCSELAASWCPICGDCICDREDGLDHPDCPLHSISSPHPRAGGTAKEAPPA